MRQIRAQQRDTVDLICHREFGYTAGVTEQTLALPENRKLAASGPILAQGTLVTLPDLPTQSEQAVLQLWD